MPYPDSEYPSVLRGRDKRESQRLLAAAPELRDSCRRLLSVLEDVYEDDFYRHGEPSEDAWPAVIAEARLAIAKAEGRE